MTPLRFVDHPRHHRQRPVGAGPDDQGLALPWNRLFHGQGRMAELVAIRFRRLLLSLADLTTVDQKVVLVGHPIDADRAEAREEYQVKSRAVVLASALTQALALHPVPLRSRAVGQSTH